MKKALQDRIDEVVEELVGTPYKHNGRSKEGVDCWGLVYLFFKKLGVDLPVNDGEHISEEWYKEDPDRYYRGLSGIGEEIGHYKNLRPLDIPYFRLYRNVITHSSVMLNDHNFIHVLIDKEVSVDTMKKRIWRRKYAGGIRLNLNKEN